MTRSRSNYSGLLYVDTYVRLQYREDIYSPLCEFYAKRYSNGTVLKLLQKHSSGLISVQVVESDNIAVFREIDFIRMSEKEVKIFLTLQNLG